MSNPRTEYLDEVMKFSAKLSAELAGLFGIILGDEFPTELFYSIFHSTTHGAAAETEF
jgi:hypothetical protein